MSWTLDKMRPKDSRFRNRVLGSGSSRHVYEAQRLRERLSRPDFAAVLCVVLRGCSAPTS